MEVAAAARWTLSTSKSNGRKFSCPSSSLLFQFKPFSTSPPYLPFSTSKSFYGQIQSVSCRRRVLEPVCASGGATTQVAERWILEPVGDGDSRHIGYKVERPGALVIASDEVIVGRVPEKADLVIAVATVSGIHARIRKNGGNLLITDLDSTNGTFVGEKRLTPGVPAPALPGDRITFGDTNLAIFMLSKLQYVEETATTTTKSEEKEESPVESIESAASSS